MHDHEGLWKNVARMPALRSEQAEVKYILKFVTCRYYWQYVTLIRDSNKYEKSGLDHSQIHSTLFRSRRKGTDTKTLRLRHKLRSCPQYTLWNKTLGTIVLFGVSSDLAHWRPFLVTIWESLAGTVSLPISNLATCNQSLGVPHLGHGNSWALGAPCTCGCLSKTLLIPPVKRWGGLREYQWQECSLGGNSLKTNICLSSAQSTLSRKAAERENCSWVLLE